MDASLLFHRVHKSKNALLSVLPFCALKAVVKQGDTQERMGNGKGFNPFRSVLRVLALDWRAGARTHLS